MEIPVEKASASRMTTKKRIRRSVTQDDSLDAIQAIVSEDAELVARTTISTRVVNVTDVTNDERKTLNISPVGKRVCRVHKSPTTKKQTILENNENSPQSLRKKSNGTTNGKRYFSSVNGKDADAHTKVLLKLNITASEVQQKNDVEVLSNEMFVQVENETTTFDSSEVKPDKSVGSHRERCNSLSTKRTASKNDKTRIKNTGISVAVRSEKTESAEGKGFSIKSEGSERLAKFRSQLSTSPSDASIKHDALTDNLENGGNHIHELSQDILKCPPECSTNLDSDPSNNNNNTQNSVKRFGVGGRLSLRNRHDDKSQIRTQKSASLSSKNNKLDIDIALKKEEPVTSNSRKPPLNREPLSCAPSLENLGNTCFLNSVIQVIFYTPELVDSIAILAAEINQSMKDKTAIATKVHPTQISPVTATPASWTFVVKLNEVLSQMKLVSPSYAANTLISVPAIRPNDLLYALGVLNPIFSCGKQQDAHEMLKCILSYLQDATSSLNSSRISAKTKHDDIQQNVNVTEMIVEGVNGEAQYGKEIVTGELKAGKRRSKRRSSGSLGECETGLKIKQDGDMKFMIEPRSKAEGTIWPVVDNDSAVGKYRHSQHKKERRSKDAVKSGALCNSSVKVENSSTGITSKVQITSYFSPSGTFKSSSPAADSTSSPLPVEKIITHGMNEVSDAVESLCRGTLKERTRCLSCEYVMERSVHFEDICLPVENQNAMHDHDDSGDENEIATERPYSWIFRVLDAVNRLQDTNKYSCNTCSHLEEAETSVYYETSPLILMFHLNRFAAFSSSFGGFIKKMDCVSIPLYMPSLNSLRRCSSVGEDAPTANYEYELYAMIAHSGISMSSGHYLTYVRSPNKVASTTDPPTNDPQLDVKPIHVNEEKIETNAFSNPPHCTEESSHEELNRQQNTESIWFVCDDDIVSEITQEKFVQMLSTSRATTPYLLFYHKIIL